VGGRVDPLGGMRVQIFYLTRVMRLSSGPTLMVRVYETSTKRSFQRVSPRPASVMEFKVASRLRTSEHWATSGGTR
jgi:hypothetical protein